MAGNSSLRSPRVLGLTGPIACGKTTVGDLLVRLGALARIDADTVVHQLMVGNTPVTAAIQDRFGPKVITVDGSVDRGRLGDVVFGDSSALRDLEAIVHPEVRAEIRQRVQSYAGQDGVVVVDAVKLLQSDLLPLCEAVWVVQCARQVEMGRLVEIRGLAADAAQRRLDAQPVFDNPAVTWVIENSGSFAELESQVRAAWEGFMQRTSGKQ
ncbi:MAG: dephospho-CoA kinase [Chloroflexota bacterium]|nr:dephospho-CoA kinase [Chloroflexota bacterium]